MLPSIEIFGRTIYTYGIFAVLGILLAGFMMCKEANKAGIDTNKLITAMLFAAIGVLVGSHILYGITNLGSLHLLWEAGSFKEFLNAFMTVFGGSVFYGGLIGGVIVGLIAFQKMGLRDTAYPDISALVAPLFHAVARIGCFFGGCCYGIESKFGFVYTKALEASANGVTRFPVQLLESLCNVLIFGGLYLLYAKGKLKGRLFPLYLMLYAVVRFSDEFLRGDLIRGFVGTLSTSQFISLFVFAAGAVSYIILKKGKYPDKSENV